MNLGQLQDAIDWAIEQGAPLSTPVGTLNEIDGVCIEEQTTAMLVNGVVFPKGWPGLLVSPQLADTILDIPELTVPEPAVGVKINLENHPERVFLIAIPSGVEREYGIEAVYPA
jgi:hypothetical protein